MRGVRLLKERALPLKLKTVGLSLNRHEIWDMMRFAEEDVGVGFKFDSAINPRIDCSQSPLAVRLSPAEVIQLDLEDPRRVSEWGQFHEKFCSHTEAEAPPSDEIYSCGGGVNSFAIDPYGQLSICVLSQVDAYDLRTGSFGEGWESFLKKVRHEKHQTRVTKCTNCRIKAMCGMCPANGELENGDPEKPVEYLCHVAHLRAYTLGLEVPAHGDCEYCVDGAHYDALADSARALSQLVPGGVGRVVRSLPIVSNASTASSCASGGCATCR